METFSASLALCAGNSPVTGNFPHKPSDAELWSAPWINGKHWVNNREAGDLRRHRGHYDVIVITLNKIFYEYIEKLGVTQNELDRTKRDEIRTNWKRYPGNHTGMRDHWDDVMTSVANRNSKDISFMPFVYVLWTSAVKACLRRECCKSIWALALRIVSLGLVELAPKL